MVKDSPFNSGKRLELEELEEGKYTGQGAYVCGISVKGYLQLKVRISHIDGAEVFLRSGFQFRSRFSVKRLMCIEDIPYTFSRGKLRMNYLEYLEEI